MAKMTKANIFRALGLSKTMKGANLGGDWYATSGDYLNVYNPTNGELLAKVEQASAKDDERMVKKSQKAFVQWREGPAPARGEIVRRIDLGRMDVGSYRDRSRAAYWDGSNSVGETVASGAYIYGLRADEQRHARRMVIWK